MNLSSALLKMANAITNPAEYMKLYQECEELLLEALRIQPHYDDANEKLAIVRKNRQERTGLGAATETQVDKDKENHKVQDHGRQTHLVQQTMSYAEAMRTAAMGELDDTAIDSIRRELAAVERSGPVSRQVVVQNNLGSALLDMADAAANPVEYVRMYKESEDLLLKVLQLQPLHTDAKANLAAVRKNLKRRPGVDGDADRAATNVRAKKMDSYGDDRKDSAWDDDDDQARAFDRCAENILQHSFR